MAVASSGSISIKTAAGSGRSIDTDGRTDISSGSLVTLSTGNVVTSGNTIDGSAPHGMREFMGYTHTLTMPFSSYTKTGKHSSSLELMRNFAEDAYNYMGFASTSFQVRAYQDGNSNWIFQVKEGNGTGRYRPESGSLQTMNVNSWYAVGTLNASSSFLPDTIRLNYTNGSWAQTYVDMWPSTGVQSSGSETYTLHTYNTDRTIGGYARSFGFLNTFSGQKEEGWDSTHNKEDTLSFTFKKTGYYDYTTPSFTILQKHVYDRI